MHELFQTGDGFRRFRAWWKRHPPSLRRPSRPAVYPFELQLGNRNFNDFLASVERVQYRYPEFPEGLTAIELYEQIIDEELKTFLRKRDAIVQECGLCDG